MSQIENPYRTPSSDVGGPEQRRALELAGKGRRFGTYVIDWIGFFSGSLIFGVVVGLTMGEAGVEMLTRIPDMLLGVIMIMSYYVFFEGIWARTPGKFLFGTVVVNEQGGRPSIGQVFGRSLCRLIPFEAFSFLVRDRGWHDSIPKTYVVLAHSPSRPPPLQ